VPIKFINYIL